MRFAHVGIVARDADALAAFYKAVFGCADRRPPRRLAGGRVSRGNGLPDSEIYSIWLTLPGTGGPFLEIHQYKVTRDRPPPLVNEPGYGHLSFEVEDIEATLSDIVGLGGTAVGEITNFGSREAPVLLVYARDPEGNVIELEQH